MNNMPDPRRIGRIIFMIEEIWRRFPNLRLGQILEIVLGKEARVMLVARTENGQVADAAVELIGPALSDISDEEFEERFRNAINGTGNV